MSSLRITKTRGKEEYTLLADGRPAGVFPTRTAAMARKKELMASRKATQRKLKQLQGRVKRLGGRTGRAGPPKTQAEQAQLLALQTLVDNLKEQLKTSKAAAVPALAPQPTVVVGDEALNKARKDVQKRTSEYLSDLHKDIPATERQKFVQDLEANTAGAKDLPGIAKAAMDALTNFLRGRGAVEPPRDLFSFERGEYAQYTHMQAKATADAQRVNMYEASLEEKYGPEWVDRMTDANMRTLDRLREEANMSARDLRSIGVKVTPFRYSAEERDRVAREEARLNELLQQAAQEDVPSMEQLAKIKASQRALMAAKAALDSPQQLAPSPAQPSEFIEEPTAVDMVIDPKQAKLQARRLAASEKYIPIWRDNLKAMYAKVLKRDPSEYEMDQQLRMMSFMNKTEANRHLSELRADLRRQYAMEKEETKEEVIRTPTGQAAMETDEGHAQSQLPTPEQVALLGAQPRASEALRLEVSGGPSVPPQADVPVVPYAQRVLPDTLSPDEVVSQRVEQEPAQARVTLPATPELPVPEAVAKEAEAVAAEMPPLPVAQVAPPVEDPNAPVGALAAPQVEAAKPKRKRVTLPLPPFPALEADPAAQVALAQAELLQFSASRLPSGGASLFVPQPVPLPFGAYVRPVQQEPVMFAEEAPTPGPEVAAPVAAPPAPEVPQMSEEQALEAAAAAAPVPETSPVVETPTAEQEAALQAQLELARPGGGEKRRKRQPRVPESARRVERVEVPGAEGVVAYQYVPPLPEQQPEEPRSGKVLIV